MMTTTITVITTKTEKSPISGKGMPNGKYELKEMMLKCLKILFGGTEAQYLANQALGEIRFLYA